MRFQPLDGWKEAHYQALIGKKMNATELFLAGNKPSGVWMCDKCRRLHGKQTDREPQASADRCCMPYICTGGCGKELPAEKYRMRCDECCSKDQQAKEFKWYEQAKKLKPSEWDGPVFDRNDNFFMSLDDYFDRYADDEDFEDERKSGTWVWCASEIGFHPNAEHMIESALDNHHEDAGDSISTADMKELEDFIEAWAKKVNIVSYEPNYKQCVLIEADENASSLTPQELLT